MSAETAGYIHLLNENAPLGGESISYGDDHLRVIKASIKGTFPSVTGAVTTSHTDLNKVPDVITDVATVKTELDALDKTAHGNVASCYWNPTFSPKLAYGHNVADVIVNPADPGGMQTKIMFTPGTMDGDPHYAFNLTPVNGTGNPTNITVVGVAADHISFLSWQLIGGTWTSIPATELGFSLMVTDMQAGQ